MNRTFEMNFEGDSLYLIVVMGRQKQNREVAISGVANYTNREEFDAYYADYKLNNPVSYNKNFPTEEAIEAHIGLHIAEIALVKSIIELAKVNGDARQYMANRLFDNPSDWLLRTTAEFGLDRPPHIEAAILALPPLES